MSTQKKKILVKWAAASVLATATWHYGTNAVTDLFIRANYKDNIIPYQHYAEASDIFKKSGLDVVKTEVFQQDLHGQMFEPCYRAARSPTQIVTTPGFVDNRIPVDEKKFGACLAENGKVPSLQDELNAPKQALNSPVAWGLETTMGGISAAFALMAISLWRCIGTEPRRKTKGQSLDKPAPAG